MIINKLKNFCWSGARGCLQATALASLYFCSPVFASGPVQATSDQSISEYLESNSEVSIFVNALKHAGQWESLKESNGLTLFVPTNDSLRSEGSAFLLEVVLQKPENKERLDELVALHLYADDFEIDMKTDQQFVMPVSIGGCLDVTVGDGLLKIGPEAQVTRSVKTQGGIIYYVDHLLWLPYKEDQPKCV